LLKSLSLELGETHMMKRALLATLVGGLLLFGTPHSASADDDKGDRKSEGRHGENDGDHDGDHDGDRFRFWDYYHYFPGYLNGGYGFDDCGYSSFYRIRGSRHHGFYDRFRGFGRDNDEGDDDENRSFLYLGCGPFGRGSSYGYDYGYGSGYRDCPGRGGWGRYGPYGTMPQGFRAQHHEVGGEAGEGCGGYGGAGYGGYGVSPSLMANMTADQEVPPAATPARGTAWIDIDTANSTVCSSLAPSGTGQPTAAHIHRGTPGLAGPAVIDLSLAMGGRTCVAGDPVLLQEIAANPGGFYVNLHTVDFPEGAVRGQLAPRPLT
jgi:hypothetical protein